MLDILDFRKLVPVKPRLASPHHEIVGLAGRVGASVAVLETVHDDLGGFEKFFEIHVLDNESVAVIETVLINIVGVFYQGGELHRRQPVRTVFGLEAVVYVAGNELTHGERFGFTKTGSTIESIVLTVVFFLVFRLKTFPVRGSLCKYSL